MKRASLTLVLLFFLSAATSAAVWTSNALGQPLEEKDSLSSAGWEREEEGNTVVLYLDGEEVWRRETLVDGERIVEGTTETRIFLSDDGRI
ncbi:MAG: hypothetical protein ACI4S4_04350, partial [Candidatus Ornithospirochaeta sp.]